MNFFLFELRKKGLHVWLCELCAGYNCNEVKSISAVQQHFPSPDQLTGSLSIELTGKWCREIVKKEFMTYLSDMSPI